MTCRRPLFPSHFTLNNGIEMPSIGIGTLKIKDADEILRTIDNALAAGYRLIDTSPVYGNEEHIKKALKTLLPKYHLKREDIFITSKISPYDLGNRDHTSVACMKSLDKLGLDYIDLYLFYSPGIPKLALHNPRNVKVLEQTWAGLVEQYDAGLVNSIGVSNFTITHLQHLNEFCHSVTPVVNQMEWHPYHHQNDILKYCNQTDIVLQAYGSLGGTELGNKLLQDPTIKKIAENHSATSAQVVLVWALQQDIAIIPKSSNPDRIKENITLEFKLTEKEMNQLNALEASIKKNAWDT